MKTTPMYLSGCLAALVLSGSALAAEPQVSPDLTRDRSVERERTYNLGCHRDARVDLL